MLRVEAIGKVYEPPAGFARLLVRTAQAEPVRALERVDFRAEPGEVVGLVGPNGAGKSTLIRICTSLLLPTTGRVFIGGREVGARSDRAGSVLGLHLTDERALYWRLTGRENLRFFAVMAGLRSREAQRRADELLEQFDLASRDRRVFGYSSGMRVRLGLARALLARPRLLILDEPTRSLGPVASSEFREHLRRVADEGAAVVFSSHRLEEVAADSDRVLVLVEGRQRAWCDTSELGDREGDVAIALRGLLSKGAVDE